MEFVDAKTIQAVEASVYKAGYPHDAVAALLIEVDGFGAGLDETGKAIVEICRRNNAYEVRVAKDDDERARLWLGRKGAFGAMGRLAPDMITMEDRKSTRLNSSHGYISYAVFCLNKKNHPGNDADLLYQVKSYLWLALQFHG